MRRPRPPTSVSVLAVLTGAYWITAWALDRDPAERPLPVPYHVVRHMERDARFRSRSPADRVLPDQRLLQVWDFDTPARLAAQLEEEALAAAWSEAGLLAGRGSARLPLPAGGLDLVLPLPATARQPDCLQLEGRLRLRGAPGPVSAELFLEGTDSTAGEGRLTARPSTELPAAPVLRAEDLVEGGWWEFSVSLSGWDAVPPPRGLVLSVRAGAAEVEWDELVLTSAPRLHGLMTGGQPRNAGVTEGTRDRKRFVARDADERLCLALAPPAFLELTLEVPPFARLELGLATLAEAVQRQDAEFTVAISREGQFEETLLRRTAGPAASHAFEDHSLDLSEFADERVRLRFRVEAARPEQASVVLLADPVLVARPEEPRSPVLLVTAPRAWLEGGEAERLLAEARLLRDYHPADPDPDRDLLSLLASQPPTAERDPRRVSVLAPRVRNLVEVLRSHGYEALAVPASWRRGPTLQGFTRRWSDPRGRDAGARDGWLLPRAGRPWLVLLDLPDQAPGDAFLRWKKDLMERGAWNACHVLLVPAGGAPGRALWRPPGPALGPAEVTQEVRALDLAPTLLAELGLPPCPDFRGRALVLAGPAAEVAAGDAPAPGAATQLRLAPLLPPRFEVLVDESQACWPLPPGAPR